MKSLAQGYVLSVGRKYFWARITINESEVDMKMPIAKLSLREKAFLAVGVYLHLQKNGKWRFLRFKPFTQREQEQHREEARRLLSSLPAIVEAVKVAHRTRQGVEITKRTR